MNSIRRAGALVAGTALALSGLTALNPAAEAAVDPATPVGQAAAWLAAQTSNGLLQSGYVDSIDPAHPWITYDDQGLTIDGIEALSAVGADSTVTTPMANAVEAQAADYAGFGTGSVAKLLVLTQVVGRDPETFGSLTPVLPAQMDAAISTDVATKGRLDGAYNVVDSQVLAVRALKWTGSSLFTDAVTFLTRSQCTSGYLQADFTTPDCVDGTTSPSVDATAYAVVELAGIDVPAVQTLVTKARAWLAGAQQADGSWSDGTLGKNANSVGLAVRALGAGPAAAKGAQWLRALQARTAGACTDKLTPVTGAIAPGAESWQAGLSGGLPATTTSGSARPLWVRATTQALPALAFLPDSTTTLHASAPQDFVRAQTAQPVSVTGATPFGAVCISGGAARVLRYVGATGAVTASVLAPAGTATRTLGLVDSAGHPASTSLKVLAAKKLAVAAPSKVKRGKKVTVKVSGLQPSEQVQVVYKGTRIRAGHANASGVFVAKFPVGRQLGKKVVRAYGQFTALRRGTDTVKVVR